MSKTLSSLEEYFKYFINFALIGVFEAAPRFVSGEKKITQWPACRHFFLHPMVLNKKDLLGLSPHESFLKIFPFPILSGKNIR